MSTSLGLRFLHLSVILCCLIIRVCSQTRDSYEFGLQHGFLSCSHLANASVSFKNNVNLLLSDFYQQSSRRGFYNTSVGDNVNKVYGYYLCRGDISPEVCNECILNGTKFVARSNCKEGGRSFISGMCFFKYSNYNTYGLWKISIINVGFVESNLTSFQQYNVTFQSTMEALINEAAFISHNNGSVLGFATKEANITEDYTIYGLAQCTPDIIGGKCRQCLKDLLHSVSREFVEGTTAGFANNLKCYLRYDNVLFYDIGE